MATLPSKSPLQMHCPKCDHYGPHKVIKTDPRPYHWGDEYVALFERLLGTDISYRVRQKQCCQCNEVFESTEISHAHFQRVVGALLTEIKRRETLQAKVSNLSARLGEAVNDHERQLAKVSDLLASKVPSFLMAELGVPARIQLPQSLVAVLRPATQDEILGASHGAVKRVRTNPAVAEKGTITCECIFGPVRSWSCSCGKYRRVKRKGVLCDRCGVDVTSSSVRRERMGHIELPCRIPNPLSGVQETVAVVAVLPPAYIEHAGLSCLSTLYDELIGASAELDIPKIMTAHRHIVEKIVSVLSKLKPTHKDFYRLALACGLWRTER